VRTPWRASCAPVDPVGCAAASPDLSRAREPWDRPVDRIPPTGGASESTMPPRSCELLCFLLLRPKVAHGRRHRLLRTEEIDMGKPPMAGSPCPSRPVTGAPLLGGHSGRDGPRRSRSPRDEASQCAGLERVFRLNKTCGMNI
jgi:hypothetical protein